MTTATASAALDPNDAGAPLTLHVVGNLLTFRAKGADTNGRFSLIEAYTAPGQGSPHHTQRDEEAFYVLEGSYEFAVGGTTHRRGPGGFIYVRPGTAHAFRNAGETPARMLILNMPAGMHEGFFLAVGEQVASETETFPPIAAPDVAHMVEAAARFDMEILPPPAS